MTHRLALPLSLTLMLAATRADAGPYIGASAQYTTFGFRDYNGLPQHGGGFTVHAGWRIGHAAIEGGYEAAGADHVSLGGETADILAFWSRGTVSPFLTAGVANLDAESRAPGNLFHESGLAWRLGAGMQFHAARLTARYEGMGFHDTHYAITVNLGLELGP
ncbi:MAG: outer membrane beta-barrel protein [Alphaproteobacteria bacterium]|nr:outer membrane beta-barrel protein [Alphaproteobacteria bacterium]MBL6939418.1 outer membrane beta-barrel protein [Alphaproteobacteria bacterium]MBL7097101.1 outer membrane beta-barrel protein [Alphaproteobacteria bacterium]